MSGKDAVKSVGAEMVHLAVNSEHINRIRKLESELPSGGMLSAYVNDALKMYLEHRESERGVVVGGE